MPVEIDLETAYKALYDEKNYWKALKIYDDVLRASDNGNLVALIYKSACLEKQYYSSADWHHSETMTIANELLVKAMAIATERGDRGKIGLVHFRLFVHYFNTKKYLEAKEHMTACKNYGYTDDTIHMWEMQLAKKLEKIKVTPTATKNVETVPSKTKDIPDPVPVATPILEATPSKAQLRTDWYQTATSINISLFTERLPASKNEITLTISPDNELTVTYPISGNETEFQYSITLAHEVDSTSGVINLFKKKIEIVLQKKDKVHWKSLANEEEVVKATATDKAGIQPTPSTTSTTEHPNSSRKKIDWSKIDLSDDEDEDSGSADAFFQKIYADADPDTRRAMMKSFVESNGTALNTNWGEVKEKTIDPHPPSDMELKKW